MHLVQGDFFWDSLSPREKQRLRNGERLSTASLSPSSLRRLQDMLYAKWAREIFFYCWGLDYPLQKVFWIYPNKSEGETSILLSVSPSTQTGPLGEHNWGYGYRRPSPFGGFLGLDLDMTPSGRALPILVKDRSRSERRKPLDLSK